MYSKTRFREILEGLPRGVFDRMVEQNQADKYIKGFTRWDQMVAMIFAQFSGVKSLRELTSAFNEQSACHYHLGTRPIKRSTLSDANAQRDPKLYAAVCQWLIQQAHRKFRKELGDLLYLMDSSTLSLQGRGFDAWASGYRSNIGQGLKLHMMIEGTQAIPAFFKISGAQRSDIKVARDIPLEKGATYVFDMGYCDYNWWNHIEKKGSTFVTRLKKNANMTRVEAQSTAAASGSILADEHIRANKRRTNSGRTVNPYFRKKLRRVTVERPNHKTPLVLVTNDFSRSADEIAALYKKRWGIELFFKWIKQNLKIKQFLGRTENAVKTQIYTALISYLLLQLYHQAKGIKTTLKLCLSTLRLNLFQRQKTNAEMARRRRQRRRDLQRSQHQLAFS